MPLLLHKETDTGGTVAVWKMKESLDVLFSKLNLHQKDRDKVNAYKLESRKKEFLATRCLIKEVLGIDAVIDYLDSGKPVIKNSDFKISISHTKGYVAVAFSRGEFAGIDIEYPSERVARVYKRFVSPQEELFIPEDKKVEYYTMMWCLKETMYKMYDRKNSIFTINFICHPFQLKKQGAIRATFDFEDCHTMDFEYVTTPAFYLVYHC
ncbi:4'-phosphopantetheinyl transferase superfamily protein [Saccharicrinis carchari]|uniref:4'-phosphopantetheinyl transferase superfamily protein n=1 Tax=Saccharicrinis carchari TaxID=1168039 RepID=A0A521CE05_SACCC|nr:4'-phosphopantetheinyl transferase superfamily protein [Saccharicrinis carchari]SMO57648.1 4'-phosphopantetheinyl transferase superfamily protein [Saccharicrinis carchari]